MDRDFRLSHSILGHNYIIIREQHNIVIVSGNELWRSGRCTSWFLSLLDCLLRSLLGRAHWHSSDQRRSLGSDGDVLRH